MTAFFDLITFAWSILASGLGVLVILRCFNLPVSTPTAIAMMIVGIASAMFWKLGLGFSGAVYEVLPGMLAGLLVYLISIPFTKPKAKG